MKLRVFLSMAVVSFLFIGQAAAQDVNQVLRNKEKRQMLYASIINNDEMFTEFMETSRASGRADVELGTVKEEPGKNGMDEAITDLEFEVSENQLMMRRMIRLMKEFAVSNPEFQKVIDEQYPEVAEAMGKN